MLIKCLVSIPAQVWFSGQFLKAMFCRFTSLSSAIYVVPVVTFTLIWNIPHFTELNTCYKVELFNDHCQRKIMKGIVYNIPQFTKRTHVAELTSAIGWFA